MNLHADGFDWDRGNKAKRQKYGLSVADKSMLTKKKIPTFKTDRAAAAFVNRADLSQYDLSGAQLLQFEIKPKGRSINLRLSEELFAAVRKRASRAGLPYQRFIRLALEQAVSGKK